jgi:hypothetical protein
MTLFDFTSASDISAWATVDDTVMGGRSDGQFRLNEEGHGVYSGHVSLENNGGFSSLRYRFSPTRVEGFTKARIRLKGDGKRYQFRVKSKALDRHSYIAYFDTSGDWEEIEIVLKKLRPTFRGRALEMPNYGAEMMTELAFLIGNKAEQDFELLLDRIVLE